MLKRSSQKSQNPERSSSANKVNSPSSSRISQHPIPLDELMFRLSQYRELDQLPMNPISQKKEQLWNDSPCTVRCTERKISLDKLERFKFGSIYHRDNINEQKKVFTESEKPELMLKNFRRQIEEATLSKRKYNQRPNSNLSRERTKSTKMGTIPLLQNNLYNIPKKIELKYDRNGSRSTYEGDYDLKRIMNKLRTTAPNFTSSQRIDLGLPLNFYPGPGEYFTKSQQFISCRSYRSRNNSKLNLQQKSPRKYRPEAVKQNF